uniref:Mab-21-like HhH/H2TH-like domain-containing protein n=1 Tax=Malurus cyaneus samueli TaxID=2593467 RepID=A0A8C5U0K7_9PASS
MVPVVILLLRLLKILILYPQPVGDGLDEETIVRMQERLTLLELEKFRLQCQVEQLILRQSAGSWADLLCSALQHGQLWALAGLLGLGLVLCFMCRKRSRQLESRSEEEKEEEKEAEEEEEEEEEEKEAEEEDEAWDYNLTWLLEERIQWPVQDLQTGCKRTKALMDNVTTVLGRFLPMTFYPRLQRAIGVGSAFEGWTAFVKEAEYRVLVPLTPPCGHTFSLELDTDGDRPAGTSVCLQGAYMLCFFHHPEEIRRRTRRPILLDTLCTDLYLDVRKTARWFSLLLRAFWRYVPESRSWHLELLPARRSCKFRLTQGQESFRVKVQFGVRRGASDVFVSSRPAGFRTPRTMWPESYGVAEMKFLRHVTRQAPQDSSHLRCLTLMAGLLARKDFSRYFLKTVIMRLLNTLPLSQWRSSEFLFRLSDILEQLRFSLEQKQLDHFFVGNQRLPQEISLPPDIRSAEPPNLFQVLAQDEAAHSQAMEERVECTRDKNIPAYRTVD